MASPTPLLPFRLPRFLDLSGDTLIVESSRGIPRSLNIPSRHATLSDPGDARCANTHLRRVRVLPSTVRKMSAITISHLRDSITSTSRLAACLSYFLRLTHVVTSIGPRFASRCVGRHFPVRTFTSDMLGASWRTLTLHIICVIDINIS